MKPRITKQDVLHVTGLGSLFLLIYQNIWVFVETEAQLKTNFIPLIIGSLLLSIVVYSVSIFLIRRLRKESIRFKIEENMEDSHRIIKEFEDNERYYEMISTLWRSSMEYNKLQNIKSGEWTVSALETYEYLRYVFGQILRMLDKGDTYKTLSNLDFWEKERYGGTDFIAMNVAAAKKDVNIQRIIVIDNEIFSQPKQHEAEIKALNNLLQEFEDSIPMNSKESQNIKNYFYLSEDYKSDVAPPYPFAIISNEKYNTQMAVLPNVIEKDKNPHIDVKFLNERTALYFQTNLARFDKLYRSKSLVGSEGIKYLLNSLDQS